MTQNESESPRVFVSYAHKNSEIVLPVIESIIDRGYSVWYDKGINLAATWTDEIAQAIINCEIVVAFISKEFAASKYARNEIEFALSISKRVIPVYLDDMSVLPPGLALGLSATQGVVDKTDAYEIANQVCAGLEFYAVRKQREEMARRKRNRRISMLAAIAVFFIALIGGYLYYGDEFSNPYKITLDKQIYLPAERILAQTAEITPEMINDGAIIGIWNKYEQSRHTSLHYGFIRDSARLLRAPAMAGEYEARAYSSADVSPATLKSVAAFSVVENSLDAFKISIDKEEYALGEQINVVVNGVSPKMLDDGPIVGLYKGGARHDDYMQYLIIRSASYRADFIVVYDEGEYEIRAYSNPDVWSGETLVASIKFTVAQK
ncbi:MAG: toll/interleukin-1 receptor domain-containing protein [Helicobacteraceae bacterium]|jgi:hypothetical protein|nr:toll/interleukin-1 receptor domain-containing protein [Helicobacteraceae bacterium]